MFKPNKLLAYSFIILNLFGWVTFFGQDYGLPELSQYFLSVIAFGTIVWYRFKKPSVPVTGGFFPFFLVVFTLYSLVLILVSILGADDPEFIPYVFGAPLYFMPYLLPLFLLFTMYDLEFFKDFFYYSFNFLILALIVQLFIILTSLSQQNWEEQASLVRIFDIGGFFLLVAAHLCRKRYVFNIAFIYWLLWVFMWLFYGRRGMLLESALVVFFMVIIRLRSSLTKTGDRMKLYFAGMVSVMLLVTFGYLLTSTYAFQRGFNSSAFEESRGMVIETFFFDFHTMKDWVFGRGLDGTVLRSFTSFEQYTSVENGLLTILLKGGLVYTIPYLFLLFRASYLGFFRSKNDLTKALAAYILTYILIMVYFNVPDYSTHYIFVWISASACFTPSLRNHTNEEVYEAVNSRFR